MPPVNDDFANAIDLGIETSPLTFSNVGATAETGEPPNAEGHSVWFKITPSSAGTLVVWTSGTPLPDWDSYLSVLTGSTVSALTEVGWDDDSDLQPGHVDTFGTSRVSVPVAAGVTYYIQVSAYDDVSGPVERSDLVLGWVLAPPAPTITSFTPSSGKVGVTVTITGTHFVSIDTVTICGTPAAFTVVSSTQITATVPSGGSGPGAIVVTNAGGSGSRGGFTPLYPGPWIQPADTETTLATVLTVYVADSIDVELTDPAPDPTGTPSSGHFSAGHTSGANLVSLNLNTDATPQSWVWEQTITVVGIDLDATVTDGANLYPVTPDPTSFPPDALDYEYELDHGSVTGPLRLQVDFGDHDLESGFEDDVSKSHDPTLDVFATRGELRRLVPSTYDFSGTWPEFTGDVWPAKTVLAAANLLNDWLFARTGADITDGLAPGYQLSTDWIPDEWTLALDVADLDVGNLFVMVSAVSVHTVDSQWALPYYTVGGALSGASKFANSSPLAQMVVAYRPPRYRFLFPHPVATTTPRLRQSPRDDKPRRQGRRNNPRAAQSSQRQGHRNTYR